MAMLVVSQDRHRLRLARQSSLQPAMGLLPGINLELVRRGSARGLLTTQLHPVAYFFSEVTFMLSALCNHTYRGPIAWSMSNKGPVRHFVTLSS